MPEAATGILQTPLFQLISTVSFHCQKTSCFDFKNPNRYLFHFMPSTSFQFIVASSLSTTYNTLENERWY